MDYTRQDDAWRVAAKRKISIVILARILFNHRAAMDLIPGRLGLDTA